LIFLGTKRKPEDEEIEPPNQLRSLSSERYLFCSQEKMMREEEKN